MKLEQIAKDVYACLQPDRGLGWSNSGLVNRDGGLVVDTFWDLPHTRRLIETYASVCPDRARRVVNTHHNGDHCWGNQLFADREILGHRLVAEGMAHEAGPEVLQMLKSGRVGDPAQAWFAKALEPFDYTGIELTPPNRPFEGDLTLDLDGLEARLLYVGPAHTGGDVIVHLPAEGVVFAGDILFRLCTPIGWDGTFDNWIAALDRIVELGPAVAVPGHGPLCGTEGAVEMKAYLEYVRLEARRFFEAEVPLAEAAKRIDLGPYAGWTEPERVVFNLDRAYRELRGEPYDAPIDAGALFQLMHEVRQVHAVAR